MKKIFYSAIYVKRLKNKILRLEQDIEDMDNSYHTSFERCKECGHIHDSGLLCSNWWKARLKLL